MSSQRHLNGQRQTPTHRTLRPGWVLVLTVSLVILMPLWKPFVANLSQRYKGRINAYEIWNEPQLADFLYPWDSHNRNLLAQMTKDAIRIIQGNDESALCGSASVLPRTAAAA